MISKKRFISIHRALSNEDSPVSYTVMAIAIETSPLRILDSLGRRNLANDNGSEDKESKAFALKALEEHNDVMHPDGPYEIPEDHPYWENTPLNLFGWVEDELPNFEITDPNLDRLDIQEIKEKLITNSKKTKFSPIKITDQLVPEATKKNDPACANPWEIKDPRDPLSNQEWYTSARYFARQKIQTTPMLAKNKPKLAQEVSKLLAAVGIYKRGKNKQPFNSGTILKSFSNVRLF